MNRDGELLEMITKVERRLDALEKLSQPQEAVGTVAGFEITNGGYRVVFYSKTLLKSNTKLYTSPPNYEALVKVNEELKCLLSVAKCPECDGSGVVQTSETDIHQCRWCYEREALKKGE